MRAVQLVRVGSPLEETQVPTPSPSYGEVLIHVKAAGICHSDAHYRSGVSPTRQPPVTLGHEVAGIVEQVGPGVTSVQPGERVCLHYLLTCGHCEYCDKGMEQFCTTGKMIGKHTNGGYAEYILVPARSVFTLPDEIPFQHGAILMCSSATSLHSLAKARMKPGEIVAVFGVGGLGISAVQIAIAFGAADVFAIDLKAGKLALAERLGAIPVNASEGDPVEIIRDLTAGQGVNVALELVGSPITGRQAVRSLAVGGRAALAGLTQESFPVFPYTELIGLEAEVIGVSDHLAQEIPLLLELTRRRKLDLSDVVTRTVSLDASEINDCLDRLEIFGEDVRVVIEP